MWREPPVLFDLRGGGGWDSASEAQIESLKRAASRLRGLCGRINL